MTKPTRRSRIQAGFSLLEVLITIVVLSLGLLGFAGLQTYSLKSNRIAMQRSLATMYAYSIVDCMRANRASAVASNYNLNYGATPSPGSVAGDDLAAWTTELAKNLPTGEAQINVAGNGTVTISIRWSETVNSSDTGTHTFSTVTDI